jgi:hypothetical protein
MQLMSINIHALPCNWPQNAGFLAKLGICRRGRNALGLMTVLISLGRSCNPGSMLQKCGEMLDLLSK